MAGGEASLNACAEGYNMVRIDVVLRKALEQPCDQAAHAIHSGCAADKKNTVDILSFEACV